MTYDPRYLVMGSSNGLVYERDHGDDLEEVLRKARQLVDDSVGSPAPLSVYVWDTQATKRVGGWWVDNRHKVRTR